MKQTLALLALAQVADLVTTWFAVTHGGHEANPIAVMTFATFGVAGAAIAKLGTVPAAGVVAYFAPTPRVQALALKAFRVAALMILGVAASNVLVGL